MSGGNTGSGWGGAREGSGRPPGSRPITRQREVALKLAMDGGETPFGVMIKLMRARWKHAVDDRGEVVDLEAAKDAAYYAEKAAPYVHPKLNSIALENDSDEPFVIRFDKEDAGA